uniref:Uncharacterized protein n=1 Tax=Arundo donax TaxID=35708 RepID=A0A0A9BRM9_ARUDO
MSLRFISNIFLIKKKPAVSYSLESRISDIFVQSNHIDFNHQILFAYWDRTFIHDINGLVS